MGLLDKIRIKSALKKANQEEEKQIPTDKDIEEEQKEFLDETKSLKKMITKKKQTKNI